MKKALIVIGGLVLVVWGLLMSQGLYSSIEIEQGEQGGFILLGMDHIGPYQEIGSAFEALQLKFPEDPVVWYIIYYRTSHPQSTRISSKT